MADITKITDYNYNLDLFLAQFQNSTKLKAVMEKANDQANEIETALFEIKENFYVATAVGAQLDVLGVIFNEDRLGRTDGEYRAILQIKGALNYSGDPENIIQILKALYGATFVNYRPFYPAKFYV